MTHVFSFRFVSAAVCVAAFGLGAISSARAASSPRFSNGFLSENAFSNASERDLSNSLWSGTALTRESDGAFNDFNADVDFAELAASFDETAAVSAEELATVDSFAPIQSAPRPTERSEATVGLDGVSFSQDVVVRGSVRLPSLKALQIWGNAYVGGGKIRPDSFAGRLKEKTTGAQIGATLPLGGLSTSGYYNYHSNKLTTGPLEIKQQTNLFGVGTYTHLGGFYFALMGTYGNDKYEAKTTNAGKFENFDGYQASGYFETGYEWPTAGLFVLKPFGSYQYSYLEHDEFALGFNQAGKRNYDACYMTLGSRIDVNLGGLDSFTLQARTAWVAQLRSQNESIQNFCFGRIPGTIAPSQPYFTKDGAGSDYFWGGVGLRLSLFGAFAAAIDYDCLVNKNQTLHVGSAGLLFGF